METKTLRTMDVIEKHNYESVVSLAKGIAKVDNGKKLYYCKAAVCQSGNVYVLKSYNTPVAMFVIGSQNAVCYDFLRTEYGYTSTSMQHICKFRKWLKEKGLYNDSTVNVRFIP